MWNSTGPHYCPNCLPVTNSRGRRLDAPLELITENYSGTGVDIAQCPTCQKVYQFSYKVENIKDITEAWKR